MRWLSTVSDHETFAVAVTSAVENLRDQLGGEQPDLIVAFVSAGYSVEPDLVRATLGTLGTPHILGCSAGGVIGGGKEVELCPAVSLTAAVLPDVGITPFH